MAWLQPRPGLEGQQRGEPTLHGRRDGARRTCRSKHTEIGGRRTRDDHLFEPAFASPKNPMVIGVGDEPGAVRGEADRAWLVESGQHGLDSLCLAVAVQGKALDLAVERVGNEYALLEAGDAGIVL